MRCWFSAGFFAAAISVFATEALSQERNTYTGVLKRIEISGSDGVPQSFLMIPSLVADPLQRVCDRQPGHYDAHSFLVPNRYEREQTPAGKRKAIADQTTAARLLADAYLNGRQVTLTYRCSTNLPWIISIRTRKGAVSFRVDDLPDS